MAPDRLSDRLATLLRQRVEAGEFAPEQRLPTEQALALHYGVSRTVVREAVSRLRSSGLLVSRQGSGVYVAPASHARALDFDPEVLTDLDAVLQVVEVRGALEGEIAALAAQRSTLAQRQGLRRALERIDAAVAAGRDGVAEDLALHRAIAEASGNPQFGRLLTHLEQYLREAMHVTRGNESLRQDFADAVRGEHRAIVEAIVAGDAEAARSAARNHMRQADRRLHAAEDLIRATLARARALKDTRKGPP
ncbi:MAG: FadR family transcriptional regulator [Burkholderiaceae bacterium]|nr:FadR family transcriptional regulator [Burkholderiaceae bacterium]